MNLRYDALGRDEKFDSLFRAVYDEARSNMQQAKISKALGMSSELVNIYYDNAYRLFRIVLEVADEKDDTLQLMLLRNCAILSYKVGRYVETRELVAMAREIPGYESFSDIEALDDQALMKLL